ncbi:adenylate cyclase [Sphingobium sp. 22B]|uniref:CYTH domain-containing protein n=2 Tax=Sphingomonadaceae TaxID=41297 RepID=A0A5B8CHE6_SPHSA|nr:CYTH domain-containing protein [Sphingobium sp. RSMS]KXU31804.1 adenylate cyclase [Sphingobium sp. AM]KYC31094.1 adenylate cyclase [Sphingobium sp. 22B]OAP31006.1 adenylate cyclase [Sphingobium sp. 20006FA]PNQ00402.1 adenylate cyclase [Sphingobium sp. SA916]QDC38968.1 CYTH domain-containing protein [Sphingobium fuliginis ATCC 27551]
MAVEIERKFLVVSDEWRAMADAGRDLRQGYVAHDGHASVRVRLSADGAWLTVKSARAGLVRDEFEYAIPAADAEDMLDRLCVDTLIRKTRYRVPHDGKVWEVDVFAGAAEGLVLAEVEMRSIDERFDLPDWVGDEVTSDPRFRNSAIALMRGFEAAV